MPRKKQIPKIVKPFMHEGCTYLGANKAGEFIIQNETGVWRTADGKQLDFVGESLPDNEIKKLKK